MTDTWLLAALMGMVLAGTVGKEHVLLRMHKRRCNTAP